MAAATSSGCHPHPRHSPRPTISSLVGFRPCPTGDVLLAARSGASSSPTISEQSTRHRCRPGRIGHLILSMARSPQAAVCKLNKASLGACHWLHSSSTWLPVDLKGEQQRGSGSGSAAHRRQGWESGKNSRQGRWHLTECGDD
jgi:hypothetical protein